MLLVAACVPAIAVARVPYNHCFQKSAERHDMPVSLLRAVAAVESNFNPRARSHANAHGLMQIQWPGTARHLGVRRISELYDPCRNVDLGAKYLRELHGRYGGDTRRALAAYNYGPGRIKTSGSIPRGASRYAQKVRAKQARLGGTPTRVIAGRNAAPGPTTKRRPGVREPLLDVGTRARAQRYVKLLERRVVSAQFGYRRRGSRYEIWVDSGANGLSKNDRIVLESLGWKRS